MLKRYIGPDPAEIVVNGKSYGEIEPGDSLAVPDDVANAAKWSPKLWEDVVSSPKQTVKKEND